MKIREWKSAPTRLREKIREWEDEAKREDSERMRIYVWDQDGITRET